MCSSTLASGSDPQMHYILCNLLLLEQKQKNNLALDSSISKTAVFQPNSRSGCIETISPNSASLTIIKALSLRLLSAIDLESPSLYGDFSLSPVLNALNALCLSYFLCLSLPISRSLTCSLCMHINEMCLVPPCLKVVYPNVGGSCCFTGLLITYSG